MFRFMSFLFVGVFILFIKITKRKTTFGDIEKLSLNEDGCFVVLNDGFYIYNFKFFNCTKFNSDISNYYSFNNAAIFQNNYLDIIPCEINNNYTYFVIVSLNNDESNIKFDYYYFVYNNNKIYKSNKISLFNMNVKNNIINCQINSDLSYIYCFYYNNINNKNYIYTTIFSIENSNINIKETFEKEVNHIIKGIKSVVSFNNKFFICIININNKLNCYINDCSKSQFEKVKCDTECGVRQTYYSNYKLFYFNETGDFMFNSRSKIITLIVSSFNDSIKVCCSYNYFKTGSLNNEEDFSIIYNNSNNFLFFIILYFYYMY